MRVFGDQATKTPVDNFLSAMKMDLIRLAQEFEFLSADEAYARLRVLIEHVLYWREFSRVPRGMHRSRSAAFIEQYDRGEQELRNLACSLAGAPKTNCYRLGELLADLITYQDTRLARRKS